MSVGWYDAKAFCQGMNVTAICFLARKEIRTP